MVAAPSVSVDDGHPRRESDWGRRRRREVMREVEEENCWQSLPLSSNPPFPRRQPCPSEAETGVIERREEEGGGKRKEGGGRRRRREEGGGRRKEEGGGGGRKEGEGGDEQTCQWQRSERTGGKRRSCTCGD
eukprot:755205-Hanusia_phi.AAC.5